MNKTDKYSERDWVEIASYLSGENKTKSETVKRFLDGRGREIENYWTMIDKKRVYNKINVDEAWNKLFTRLDEDNLIDRKISSRPLWTQVLRIAAVVILMVATTITIRFLAKDNARTDLTAVATTITERNRVINLPDGSVVTLNRNSELSFPEGFDDDSRKVELRGEAFFNIVPDPSLPFIVDAGNARIKVLGTSFNVISDNQDNETEVFVKTGRVMLYKPAGDANITLEPGYIGTIKKSEAESKINNDPNYMSWRTNILIYDGTRLEQVFYDLKRTHNITIEVSDNSILDHLITTEFKNNSAEVIIQSICRSFTLNFEEKEGIYYLSN